VYEVGEIWRFTGGYPYLDKYHEVKYMQGIQAWEIPFTSGG
jgi:hypothetical protein